jgi:hypothetical protein
MGQRKSVGAAGTVGKPGERGVDPGGGGLAQVAVGATVSRWPRRTPARSSVSTVPCTRTAISVTGPAMVQPWTASLPRRGALRPGAARHRDLPVQHPLPGEDRRGQPVALHDRPDGGVIAIAGHMIDGQAHQRISPLR